MVMVLSFSSPPPVRVDKLPDKVLLMIVAVPE